MPDYFDPTQPQVQQPYMPQIPAPAQQMQDYSYLYQNQNVVWQQQNSVANTLRTAQWNMQQHMQNVLSGTMAASMALYQTGHNVVARGHEHKYGDTLFPGGKYVLERSMWRDTMWGMGIAQSDFGRALKIGGRKPEWLSEGEYAYQQSRSTHLRMEELGDMGIGALSSIPGMAAGMMIPGMGWAIAGGMAMDALSGFAVRGYLEHRKFGREMRHFAEQTDQNVGLGQRRIGVNTMDDLSDRMFYHDRNWKTLIPLIGDRFRHDTEMGDTFKKMSQLGLFKNTNLDNVDELERMIKTTTKQIEKYAGLLNMTKDEVLKLKHTFKQMGLSEAEEGSALNQITKISYASGIRGDVLAQHGFNFAYSGTMLGYRSEVSQREGINQIGTFAALKNIGMISQMYDPATLAQQAVQGSQAFGVTGLGKVFQYGGGSVGGAIDTFRQIGGGNVLAGYMDDLLGLSDKPGGSMGAMEKFLADAHAGKVGGLSKGSIGVRQALTYLQRNGFVQSGAQARQLFQKFGLGYDSDRLVTQMAAYESIRKTQGDEAVKAIHAEVTDLMNLDKTGGLKTIHREANEVTLNKLQGLFNDLQTVKTSGTAETDKFSEAYDVYDPFSATGIGGLGISGGNHNRAVERLHTLYGEGKFDEANKLASELDKKHGKGFSAYAVKKYDEDISSRRSSWKLQHYKNAERASSTNTLQEKLKANRAMFGDTSMLEERVSKDLASFGFGKSYKANKQLLDGIIGGLASSISNQKAVEYLTGVELDEAIYDKIRQDVYGDDPLSANIKANASNEVIRMALLQKFKTLTPDQKGASVAERAARTRWNEDPTLKQRYGSIKEFKSALSKGMSTVYSAFGKAGIDLHKQKITPDSVTNEQYATLISSLGSKKDIKDTFGAILSPEEMKTFTESVAAGTAGKATVLQLMTQGMSTMSKEDMKKIANKDKGLDQAALNDKALANLADACGKLVTLLS